MGLHRSRSGAAEAGMVAGSLSRAIARLISWAVTRNIAEVDVELIKLGLNSRVFDHH